MEARYTTHRLIDEFQREKMLETQANQEQVLPAAQDIRSKPTELKTIYQLKATDRPADIEEKMRKLAMKLFEKLLYTFDKTLLLRTATPDDITQLITAIYSCARALDGWMSDVTATATEIAAKWQNILHEDVTLLVR